MKLLLQDFTVLGPSDLLKLEDEEKGRVRKLKEQLGQGP